MTELPKHPLQTALSFWKAFPIGQTLKQILNISVLQILCGTLCGHATPRLGSPLQPDIFYDRSQVPGRAQRVEGKNYGDVFLASELHHVDFWTIEMTLREEVKQSSLTDLWPKADRSCQKGGERGIAIRLKRSPRNLAVFEVLCGKGREQNALRNGQHFTLQRGLNIEVPLGHDPGEIALDWCRQEDPAVVPHAVHAARFSLQIQSSSVGSSSLFSIACLAPRSLEVIPHDILRKFIIEFFGPKDPDFINVSSTSSMIYEIFQTYDRSQVPGRTQLVKGKNYGDVFLASELHRVDFWTTQMTLREEVKQSSLTDLWPKADRACQKGEERGIAIRLKQSPRNLAVEVFCGKECERNVLRNGQHFTLLRGLNIEVPLGHDPGKIALDWCQQQDPAVVRHAVHAARFSLQIQSSSVGSSSLFSIACLAPRSLADIPQDVLRESMKKFLGPGNLNDPGFINLSGTSSMMRQTSQTVARQYAYDDPKGRSPCPALSLVISVDSLLARISQPDRYRAFEVREGQFSKDTWNQFIQSDLFRREITELRLSSNAMTQILQSVDDYVQLIDHVLYKTQIHSFNLGSALRIIRLEADKKIRILVDYSHLPELASISSEQSVAARPLTLGRQLLGNFLDAHSALPYPDGERRLLEDLRFERFESDSGGESFALDSMHLRLKSNADMTALMRPLEKQLGNFPKLKSLSLKLELENGSRHADCLGIARGLSRLSLQGLESFSLAMDNGVEVELGGVAEIIKRLKSLPNLKSVRIYGTNIPFPLEDWIARYRVLLEQLGWEDQLAALDRIARQHREHALKSLVSDGLTLLSLGTGVTVMYRTLSPLSVFTRRTAPSFLASGLLGEELGTLLKAFKQGDYSDLTFLNIAESKLQSSEVSQLVEGFSGIPKLRGLYLSNNQIGDLGATLLAPGFSLLPNLEYLDLSQNQIETLGGIALAEGLAKARGLLYLNLQGNRIGLEGIEAFANTFEQFENLVSLDFSENNLQDLEIESLAKGLPHLSNLSSLILKGNAFRWAGLRALLSGMRDLKNLTLFDISGNKLEEELGLDQDPAEKSAYFEKMLAPLRQLRPGLKVIY